MTDLIPIITSTHPHIHEPEPSQIWEVLSAGHMLICKDAGPTYYAELFADEVDVQLASAIDPHGNVRLTVWHQNGKGVEQITVNQRSRFPLSGFSWKIAQ